MTGMLVIPMPVTCTARYLVGADRRHLSPAQARRHALKAVDDHASGTMRRRVKDLAKTPAVAFAPVSEQDWLAMTADQRELARRSGDWISITVETLTSHAPEQEWVARTLAGLLAREYDVPVLDLTTSRRLDGDELLASLHAKENGCTRFADWVSVAAAYTGNGPMLRTRGMRRYGLPELTVAGPVWRYETEWCALLTAAGFRVCDHYTDALNRVHNQAVIAGLVPPENVPGQLEFPDEVGLTGDDVADAYCLPGSFWSRRCGARWIGSAESETPVCLTVDDAPVPTLLIHPPSEWAEPGDFLSAKTAKAAKSAAGQSIPAWPALAEVAPFVTRTQLIHEFVPATGDDILADPDLVRCGTASGRRR